MKTASIHEIKQELAVAKPAELVELCLRLAKYKKENKELLGYLLFEAHNPQAYLSNVKEEIDSLFGEITTTNAYLAKKSMRKILRITNKYIKYTSSKQAEVELLIHYCRKIRDSRIEITEGGALFNLYMQQLKKIDKALEGLHEDISYDYRKDVALISAMQITPARKRGFR